MDSSCIKQAVCKVLNIFQHGKYLVAYVLKVKRLKFSDLFMLISDDFRLIVTKIAKNGTLVSCRCS